MKVNKIKFLVFFLCVIAINNEILFLLNIATTFFLPIRETISKIIKNNNVPEYLLILVKNYTNLFFLFIAFLILFFLSKLYFSEYKEFKKENLIIIEKFELKDKIIILLSLILICPFVSIISNLINNIISNIGIFDILKKFKILNFSDLNFDNLNVDNLISNNDIFFSIKQIAYFKFKNYIVFILIYIILIYIFASVEEYVFRKTLFSYIHKDDNLLSILFSNSLIFAFIHLSKLNISSFIFSFIFSIMFLTMVYYLYNDFKFVSFLHFLINFINLIFFQIFDFKFLRILLISYKYIKLAKYTKLYIFSFIILFICFISGFILWYIKIGSKVLLKLRKKEILITN